MFMTRSQQSRARVEALEILACGGSPRLHSVGPIRSCRPDPEMRVFAFASYVAALDSEEAAAADLAALACPAAA